MSLTELKAEIAQLSPGELEALRSEIEVELTKKQTTAPTNMAEYFGCMRGTAVLKPGWDADEPLEDWEALRDDASA